MTLFNMDPHNQTTIKFRSLIRDQNCTFNGFTIRFIYLVVDQYKTITLKSTRTL